MHVLMLSGSLAGSKTWSTEGLGMPCFRVPVVSMEDRSSSGCGQSSGRGASAVLSSALGCFSSVSRRLKGVHYSGLGF